MANFTDVVQWLSAFLLLGASFFMLVGAIGFLRLPDFFMRLHAPTKASTLGVGGVLIVSILLGLVSRQIGFAEVLITIFVFVSAPVSANILAQAALHLGLPNQAGLPDKALLP